MNFVIARVYSDGTVRAEDTMKGDGWAAVIHSYTTGVMSWGGTVYKRLDSAKRLWTREYGPDSDGIIVELDDEGGAAALWMADRQMQRLESSLNTWKSCYGGWKRKKLNCAE